MATQLASEASLPGWRASSIAPVEHGEPPGDRPAVIILSGKLDVLDDPLDLGSDAGLLIQLAERRLARSSRRLDVAGGNSQPAKACLRSLDQEDGIALEHGDARARSYLRCSHAIASLRRRKRYAPLSPTAIRQISRPATIAPTQEVAWCAWTRRHAPLPHDPLGLLPPFVRDPKAGPPMINARGEGIATKNAFRRAFAERRCLVPADGFYRWTGPKGKRRPFCSSAKGRVYRLRRNMGTPARQGRKRDDSVAMITCDANERSRRCMTACRWSCGVRTSKRGWTARRPRWTQPRRC